MSEKTKNALVTLSVGLLLNISLGVAKLVVGLIAGSMSVTSDGVNNLSDAAVSIVSIIAVALSNRAADRDHPYGHGRYEYIATFVLGAVIVAVGVEVFRGGVERAITPSPVDMSVAVIATLITSVVVKAAMGVFYCLRAKRGSADTVRAAAVDSFSDCVVTTAVLVCAVIEKYCGVTIDGYASIGIAVVILVFAVKILRDVINRLLGSRPDKELVSMVYETLNGSSVATNVHDLVINDYGENNMIAEVDLVFPAELAFVDVHAECDRLEREVLEKTGVKLSIHADPLVTTDERVKNIEERVKTAISGFGATAHEIGIDDCKSRITLGLGLGECSIPIDELKGIVEAEVRSVCDYSVEIHVDYL